MLGFGFDIPQIDLGYQAEVKVHVIKDVTASNLTLKSVDTPKKLKVKVYFSYDSAILRESEKKKLKRISGKVILHGHASPEGSERYNMSLSEKRALSVKNYLESIGVQVKEIKAFGESRCNKKPTEWYMCRRVDVYEEIPNF